MFPFTDKIFSIIIFIFIVMIYFFFSTHRNLYSISWKAKLLVLNSKLLLVCKTLYCSFKFESEPWWIEHVWFQVFSFQHFEYIVPNLLVFKVSVKESPVSFMGVSLMYNGFFFLSAFNILFIFNFYSFNYNVSCCGSLWIHLVWDSISP